jgi:uncharacterized protein YjbJ (UPF0337 family)
MNEFKKKAVDEEVGGQAQNAKGKIKEAAGKVFDREDWEAEGQADQAEGQVREDLGKAGRKISDVAERAGEKLRGEK